MNDKPFSEQEAANRLGFSKATLMRERIAGKIHPMRGYRSLFSSA